MWTSSKRFRSDISCIKFNKNVRNNKCTARTILLHILRNFCAKLIKLTFVLYVWLVRYRVTQIKASLFLFFEFARYALQSTNINFEEKC